MKGKFENVVLIDVDGDRHENVIGIDAPECLEKRIYKVQKTYTGKTSCGKHSVGKLHEWWEKAYERKKYNVRNGQSGLEDHTNALGSLNDIPTELEEENRAQQSAQSPASSVSGDSNIQKQNSSTIDTSDNYSGGTYRNCGTESPFVESDKKLSNESFSPPRNGDQEFSWTTSNCDPYSSYLQHGRMGSNGNEKLQSKEPSMPISVFLVLCMQRLPCMVSCMLLLLLPPLNTIPKLSEEKQVGDGVIRYDVEAGTVVDKYSSVKTQLGGMPVVSSKDYCNKEKTITGKSSHYDVTQIKQISYWRRDIKY
ncbi:hypothetical protein Golax_000652 [Gossypium laxum]|uniref:Uncharacterized protein n=1 Tax=Gossypium laxum TaxID=34288 RepID=A0A7J9AWA8_9ROSI|nr:hypothetical protein [Gossypium laxum]